jgi:hypothetical protein
MFPLFPVKINALYSSTKCVSRARIEQKVVGTMGTMGTSLKKR